MAAVATMLLTLGATGAGAAVPTTPAQLPPSVDDERWRDVAALVGQGLDIEPHVQAAAAAAGVPLGDASALPAPGSVDDAIDAIVAATAAAGADAVVAVGDASALQALPAQADDLLSRAMAHDTADAFLLAAGEALAAQAEAAVDRPALYTAAAGLAAAIDAALPVLQQRAGALPTGATGPAEGVACDVIDQPPVLCVGGEGANTYTADVAVQIDLGGDDVYRNTAGGADPQQNGLPAAVTIDLGGDDQYLAELPMADGARAVQGGGAVGGIGVLVDVSGHDRYVASGPTSAIRAQGAGYGGVGILLDGDGDDVYESVVGRPGQATANVQGNGHLGGMGLLIDAAGDDAYTAEARPDLIVSADGLNLASADVTGHGHGNIAAVGVFLDGGGRDVITARAIAPRPQEQDWSPVTRRSVALVTAAGAASVGGVGIAVTGDGDTTWQIEVEAGEQDEAQPRGSSGALAQGTALVGGYAALVDRGGDDVYDIRAVAPAVRRLIAEPGCTCPDLTIAASDVFANGQGYANIGAVAVLHDGGGDDRYVASARGEAVIELTDLRGDTASAREIVLGAHALRTSTSSQGAGFLGADAALVDVGGDDSYDAEVDNQALASVDGPEAGSRVSATAGGAGVATQAASGGGNAVRLLDLGGLDAYRARGSSQTSTPLRGIAEGEVHLSAQGAWVEGGTNYVTGMAWLADLGDSGGDVFEADPADEKCQGEPGAQSWLDCGTGLAGGVNP